MEEKKYKNITWNKEKSKWQATVMVGGKKYRLGYSKDPEELYNRIQPKLLELEEKRIQYISNISEDGEVWKEISGYGGKYEISNFGRIKNYGEVKSGIISDGLSSITLRYPAKDFQISYLVITYFGDFVTDGIGIRHLDGDTSNNRRDNLEIYDISEEREIIIKQKKEEAKLFKGVSYKKEQNSFTGEFKYQTKRRRFSGNTAEKAYNKLVAAKEMLYKKLAKEVEDQLLPNEEWKEVRGTEGKRYVSNLGRVMINEYPHKELTNGTMGNAGYYRISISRDGFNRMYDVHQIIAETFLGHVINGHFIVVDHIDFNRINNCVDNLQLISNRENSGRKDVEGYKYLPGVTKVKGRFRASIVIKGKTKHLGSFSLEEDAHQAYINAVNQLEF